MIESHLGYLVKSGTRYTNEPNDIMQCGNPADPAMKAILGEKEEYEVDIKNGTIKPLSYSNANINTPGEAIKWATCWLYHKAQRVNGIKNDEGKVIGYKSGPWRNWVPDSVFRYGPGDRNPQYIPWFQKVYSEGLGHNFSGYLWPIMTNGKARE